MKWVIDPIDGTRAFMSGMPAWGTLLGLTNNGSATIGVVHQPYLEETFYGDRERAWLKRRGTTARIHARDTQAVADAVLYSTHPNLFTVAADRQAFDALAGQVRMMRFGGDCYSYCLLALGQLDLVVEAGLKPHDIVPLIPVIEGAGGIVTDWEGGDPHQGGRILAAAGAVLHRQVRTLLGESRSG
jgi:myo-inositol-1(or 4)-monophosphatase